MIGSALVRQSLKKDMEVLCLVRKDSGRMDSIPKIKKIHGVSFPDLSKIAWAYGIKYFLADGPDKLEDVIKNVLSFDDPVVCEVKCDPNQEIIPSVASRIMTDGAIISTPIDDMYPFLDRDEYYLNTPP
jgi:acetolactate synthase-1/2/3 large subunit